MHKIQQQHKINQLMLHKLHNNNLDHKTLHKLVSLPYQIKHKDKIRLAQLLVQPIPLLHKVIKMVAPQIKHLPSRHPMIQEILHRLKPKHLLILLLLAHLLQVKTKLKLKMLQLHLELKIQVVVTRLMVVQRLLIN
jgi:hypothetical protein